MLRSYQSAGTRCRVEPIELGARYDRDLLGGGRIVLAEELLVGVGLDQAPASGRRREADHQQRIEAELLQELRLIRLGRLLAQRDRARLAALDHLLRERVLGDQVLVPEVEAALAVRRELDEPDQQVADDARDLAGGGVEGV